MNSEQKIRSSICTFIELEGFKKERLAKKLKIDLKTLEKNLKGDGVNLEEFAKEMAKINGFNEHFFLDDRANLYNKSKLLGLIQEGNDYEKFVSKENKKKILEKRKEWLSIKERIEENEKELRKLEHDYHVKRVEIENLL